MDTLFEWDESPPRVDHTKPLDEVYFEWLYSHIGAVKLRNRSKSYWNLARQLFQTEFIWFVPNDDNRVADGRDLRYEFIDEHQIDGVDMEWLHMGCSMLELLIGLSRRLAFEAEGRPRFWFWKLIDNIGLTDCNDRIWNQDVSDHVTLAVETVIWRTYNRYGEGGLFPLRHADRKDQREEELWYQLSTYVLDRNRTRGG